MNRPTIDPATNLDPAEPAYPHVVKGVAWLDEHHPGWADRIDPETLAINSMTDCVLCQVAGIARFVEASESMFGVPCWDAPTEHLGFDLPPGADSWAEWTPSADRLWKAAAAARATARPSTT